MPRSAGRMNPVQAPETAATIPAHAGTITPCHRCTNAGARVPVTQPPIARNTGCKTPFQAAEAAALMPAQAPSTTRRKDSKFWYA